MYVDDILLSCDDEDIAKKAIDKVIDSMKIGGYITERATWNGGYRERIMRMVKASLRKVLGNALLEEDEDLLYGTPNTNALKKRLNYRQNLLARFWKRWQNEYIVNLS
ncbi:hypothetical protein T11_8908 [Trichinella zimbabwensis]|uniref:Uncharacterized protein n=1 Tax=Trichinella zimbabwensis TaxID=268475 RepID=A0A0V1I8K7_9BILA|nr:hypothetical protein T11_8908 [Trichinella zimbabwensis]